jgi:hypothetical protein
MPKKISKSDKDMISANKRNALIIDNIKSNIFRIADIEDLRDYMRSKYLEPYNLRGKPIIK